MLFILLLHFVHHCVFYAWLDVHLLLYHVVSMIPSLTSHPLSCHFPAPSLFFFFFLFFFNSFSLHPVCSCVAVWYPIMKEGAEARAEARRREAEAGSNHRSNVINSGNNITSSSNSGTMTNNNEHSQRSSHHQHQSMPTQVTPQRFMHTNAHDASVSIDGNNIVKLAGTTGASITTTVTGGTSRSISAYHSMINLTSPALAAASSRGTWSASSAAAAATAAAAAAEYAGNVGARIDRNNSNVNSSSTTRVNATPLSATRSVTGGVSGVAPAGVGVVGGGGFLGRRVPPSAAIAEGEDIRDHFSPFGKRISLAHMAASSSSRDRLHHQQASSSRQQGGSASVDAEHDIPENNNNNNSSSASPSGLSRSTSREDTVFGRLLQRAFERAPREHHRGMFLELANEMISKQQEDLIALAASHSRKTSSASAVSASTSNRRHVDIAPVTTIISEIDTKAQGFTTGSGMYIVNPPEPAHLEWQLRSAMPWLASVLRTDAVAHACKSKEERRKERPGYVLDVKRF